ncbi:MAG: hypothetical protein J6J44_04510 [Lachnospiraceae bacterium]|nr:hypothetical protein [Lachnospiraceae bacterium]
MKKIKIFINCLMIIIGSFIGAFMISLLLPGAKEQILMVALGTSIGIIFDKYVIKRKK